MTTTDAFAGAAAAAASSSIYGTGLALFILAACVAAARATSRDTRSFWIGLCSYTAFFGITIDPLGLGSYILLLVSVLSFIMATTGAMTG